MKILATLGDSLIVGINGRLRVVDIKTGRCHGYALGCQCPKCRDKERALRRQRMNLDAKKAAKCECGGFSFDGQNCHQCGKAVARAA